MAGRLTRLGALALGALLMVSGTASAASLTLESGTLRYAAAAGERNYPNLDFNEVSREWTIFEEPSNIELGANCSPYEGAFTAVCSDGEPPRAAELDLGDGNDLYQHFRATVVSEGVQTIESAAEPFALAVAAGPGDDEFWMAATGSPTSLDGGEGSDTFQFYPPLPGAPTTPVDLYRLLGGGGDDRLQVPFNHEVNPLIGLTMDGGAGADNIIASPGPDQVYGGPGPDTLSDGGGDDLVSAGGEDDMVFGGDGDDILALGDGSDSTSTGNGSDRVFGEGGDDRIAARGDPQSDDIGCGPGDDQVEVDPSRDLVATDCEQVAPQPARCPWGVQCVRTVSLVTFRNREARASRRRMAGRLVLGEARLALRGFRRYGPLPLSPRGRRYVARRGLVRARLVTRVFAPRKSGRPDLTVHGMRVTLRAP